MKSLSCLSCCLVENQYANRDSDSYIIRVADGMREWHRSVDSSVAEVKDSSRARIDLRWRRGHYR